MKELAKEIKQVFRRFITFTDSTYVLRNPKDRDTVTKFLDHIGPSSDGDTGVLPYYNGRVTAKNKNKAECVFAIMSMIIVNYWCAVQTGMGVQFVDECILDIRDILNDLKTIHENYGKLFVCGNPKDGYRLVSELPKEKGDEQSKVESVSEEDSTPKTDERIEGRSEGEETQIE